jgi:hypothetical protein
MFGSSWGLKFAHPAEKPDGEAGSVQASLLLSSLILLRPAPLFKSWQINAPDICVKQHQW